MVDLLAAWLNTRHEPTWSDYRVYPLGMFISFPERAVAPIELLPVLFSADTPIPQRRDPIVTVPA
jgi:hypothetical protein